MNTTELLASIKRGVSEPASQTRLTDTDILALADEETLTRLLPMLTSTRSEFLVRKDTQTVTAGTDAYRIPYRAVGRTIRDLKYVVGGTKRSLPMLALEDEHLHAPEGQSGEPVGFYFMGDSIILTPVPSAAASMEFWYELSPSALTETTNAGVVTSYTATTVTVASLPSAIVVGAQVDLIAAKPGNNILSFDLSVTNVASTTLTVSAVPSTLAVGDYVALAGYSPVVQLPKEMHQVLAQAVQCRMLEALGDFENLQVADKKLQDKIRAMNQLLMPRMEGASQVIMNPHGFLRGRRAWR